MAEGGVSGKSLAIALTGAILAYSAVKGHKVSTTIRDLIAGKDPTKDNTVDVPVQSGAGNGINGAFDPTTVTGGNANIAPAGKMTAKQIFQLTQAVGFNPFSGTIMTAIALAESSGDPNNLNNNPSTGDLSYGLWQINMIGAMGPQRRQRWGLSSNDQLFNPMVNAKAAYDISHGGTVFTDWTTFTSGAYQQYLAGAAAAARG